MKKSGLGFLSLLLVPALAQASALVIKDDKARILKLVTQLNYLGTAASLELAQKSSEEISRMWNAPKATVQIDGKIYFIQFQIGYSVNDSVRLSKPSPSCGENFVEIEPKTNPSDRSYYSLFGRTGRFYTSDDLGRSTTTAHEFGHGLGLDHNDGDQLNASVPGIMFARGTLVKPQFQWNPSAQPGQPGGTLNPIYRKVRAEDVAVINFSDLVFTNGKACIGEGTATSVILSNPIAI